MSAITNIIKPKHSPQKEIGGCCETCVYWNNFRDLERDITYDVDRGHCNRYPPVKSVPDEKLRDDQGAYYDTTNWMRPVTWCSDVCGEYKQRRRKRMTL
ncbi:MAG: hypothetical protein NTV22_11465 [bacterium]|nr:hypothetical protein [bacterium]